MSDHYRQFFEAADVDQSGHLSEAELIGALRKGGYKGDDDAIKVYKCSPVGLSVGRVVIEGHWG